MLTILVNDLSSNHCTLSSVLYEKEIRYRHPLYDSLLSDRYVQDMMEPVTIHKKEDIKGGGDGELDFEKNISIIEKEMPPPPQLEDDARRSKRI